MYPRTLISLVICVSRVGMRAKMEYGGTRRGIHISLNAVQRYVSPLFFLLLLKEISSTSSSTTTFKTGIKLWRLQGVTHITQWTTGAEICVSHLYFLTFRVIPCWMKFFQSYLDKERNENECLHQHCGPGRSPNSPGPPETALRLFCLESFLFCR